MKIIIAGSREFNNYNFLKHHVENILETVYSPYPEVIQDCITIISGHANGADKLGERFAIEHHMNLKLFPADWNTFGMSAGYKRNVQMAEFAKDDDGMLIAFHVDRSKGTQHMINIAKKYGLKTFVIQVNSHEY
jgi:hypothetical protein